MKLVPGKMDLSTWSVKAYVSSFFFVIFIIVTVFKATAIIRLALFSDLGKIPGPWYAKWTNLMLKWHVIRGQRSMYIHALHSEHGQFVRISPTEVAVSNLEAYKAIHRVGSGFNKSSWYQKFNEGPPGVFAMSDPKQHATRRRLFAQAFSNSSIQTYETTIKDRVEVAVRKIKRDARAGNADMLKWFTFMATDVSGELSFGKSFEMLQQEMKSTYIHDLEVAMMTSGISVELGPLVRFLKLLPIPSLQQIFSIGQRLDAYGHQAIQNLRDRTGANSSRSRSIFTNMIDQEKNADLTDEEIGHEAANLIVAGSDTTAVSLTYTIWALLRPMNQVHKENLLRELSTAGHITKLSQRELAALPYLNATIKEGLRLYGAAPGSLPRIVPQEGTVLCGYALPGGVTVSTQAYTNHRDAQVFQDPDRFIPDRWLNPTSDMNSAFAAFGTGSRTCLGIHLAMLELQIGICTFFQECPQAVISPTTTDKSMEFINHFLIAPKGGKCEITILS